MSVSAVSHFVTTTAQLAAPHYIKVAAVAFTVFGGIWAGNRMWNLSCYEKLDAASTRVGKKLCVVNLKLSNWTNDDAKGLRDILYSNDLCEKNNPLPHMEFAGPKSAPHFQTAVGLVKTLTTSANRFSATQDKWLKETKDKAEEWLKAKDKLGRAVHAKLYDVDNVVPILLANKLLGKAIDKAKKQIEKEKVTAETIQTQMKLVKIQYQLTYKLINPEIKEGEEESLQVKKIKMLKISVNNKPTELMNCFPEDDKDLKELSNDELTTIFTAQGKIKGDDKTKVDQAIAGLAHEDLLNALKRDYTNDDGVDSVAKTAYDEFKKWNQDTNDLYKPLKWCVGIAMVALAANWGAPRYLGADHHFVQLFKLPA